MKRLSERSLLKSFVIVAATAAAIVMTTVSIALIATATDVTTDTGKTAVTHEDITGIADIGNVRTPDAEISTTPSTYIADGVYAIKNLYSGWYIDIAQNSPLTGKYVQQYNYTTSPANNSKQRWGLYKVTRVSGNDYVIRTMIENGNTFVANTNTAGSYIRTAGVEVKDSNVSDLQKWTITAVDGGYIIRPKGVSSLALCVQNNTSSGGGATNAASRLTLQNRNDNYAKWTFTKLSSGITFNGVVPIWHKSTLLPGEEFLYQYGMYSTTIGVNGPVKYAVTAVGGGTTDMATINMRTGLLVAGQKVGKFGLRLKVEGLNDRGLNITIEEPLKGNFYIQCYNKSGICDVGSDNSNAQIICQDLSQKTRFLWKFEYQNDGFYTIRNDKTGYYLTDVNGSVKQTAKSGNFTREQCWHLLKQSDGSYMLQCKNNTSYYLAEASGNHGLTDPKIITAKSDAGTRCKWQLTPLTLNLTVRYDPAFSSRYGQSALESAFGNNSAGKSVSSFFLEQFGIHVKVNYIETAYQSYPYQKNCTHKNSFSTICYDCKNEKSNTIEWECQNGYHHKSAEKMLMDSVGIGSSSTVNIVFTGHKSCGLTSSGAHTENQIFGISIRTGNSVAVLAYRHSDFPVNTNEIIDTIVHELLHIAGAGHCTSSNCMMSQNDNYTKSSLPICNLCKTMASAIKCNLFNH